MKVENYNQAITATSCNEFRKAFKEGCSRCSLCYHHVNPVIYRGNPEAKIVLAGEAPGAKEDQDGSPFSGPAGKLLDKIFDAIGIDTNRDMLLTNCVFCRPVSKTEITGKQNYTPKEEQLVRCYPFTRKLIEIVNPKIIIACGGVALKKILDDNTLKITALEGEWISRDEYQIFPMTHPAAVLHQSNYPEIQKATKVKMWGYMKYFRDTYRRYL